VASEWLSTALGITVHGPSDYTGSENSDGGVDLTLATAFSPLLPGYITHIAFWKTSIDAATTRKIGFYEFGISTPIYVQDTVAEPVGAAGWVEVELTTPLAVTGGVPMAQNYYAAVSFPNQKYPATAHGLDSSLYTPANSMYLPNTFDVGAAGGIGNGGFHYGTGELEYPDGSFNNGYYWVDVKWVDALPVTGVEDAFQSAGTQSDAFQTHVEGGIFALEGADKSVFNITSTTFTGLNVTEGADLASFNVISRTYVNFTLTEGADIAAINTTSTTLASFNLVEGKDTASFHVLTGARFSFDLVEGADIANFRTFATYWTTGDADYIVVPQENQIVTMKFDNSLVTVHPENQVITIRNEQQRVDVDQTRGRRDET